MQPRYQPVTVSDKTTYFTAIARYQGRVHNFVIMGCHNGFANDSHQYHILSAAGKAGSPDDAGIMDEPAAFRSQRKSGDIRQYEIVYQAYEISLEQYTEHTQLLNDISQEEFNRSKAPKKMLESFNFYYPTSYDRNLLIHTTQNPPPTEQPATESQRDVSRYFSLSLSNTCRHTALDFLANVGIKDNSLSKSFLGRLANKLKIIAGVIKTPMFILPPPVTSSLKKESPLQYKILTELRQRIVALSKTRYNSDAAVHKVDALRHLFNRINKEQYTAQAMIDIIQAWQNDASPLGNTNADLISTQRRTLWFSCFNPTKSSSEKLIDSLLLTLQQSCTPKPPETK